jgi:nitroreductase
VSDEHGEGLEMPLVEAMETQRAVRRLKTDPVDDATILRVLELATKAPTGSNRQGWEFVVVRDPDVKHQLARLNRQAWAVYRRRSKRQVVSQSRQRILDAVQWQADHFEEVPVIIVVCLHGKPPLFKLPVKATSWYGSAYPAVQNLLLAARALGLGATLTTFSLWSTTLARRTLGLPPKVTPVAVIPMGWPIGRYGPTSRKPVGDVVHLDRYGNQPFR